MVSLMKGEMLKWSTLIKNLPSGPFKSLNQLRKPIEIVLLNSSNDEASQFL